jgi:uncharacterized membrane protein YphA (DoxX/SURF4 family)
MSTSERARRIAAFVLALYLSQLFLRMGWGKFGGDRFWTTAFAGWGYPAWFRVLVGAVEVTGGVAILVPRVASYGALALAVVMMGAWSTLAHDLRWRDMTIVAAYGAGLGWIASTWWSIRFRRDPLVKHTIRPADG